MQGHIGAETYITSGLSLLVLVLTAYLMSYWKKFGEKRGELQAMHEGIDKLIEQVDTVQKRQEQMKAEILDAMWHRQTHYTMKKEILFDTLREVGVVQAALSDLHGACLVFWGTEDPALRQTNAAPMRDSIEKFKNALYKLGGVRTLAIVVSNEKTREALYKLQILFSDLASQEIRGVARGTAENDDLVAQLTRVTEVIREELQTIPASGLQSQGGYK